MAYTRREAGVLWAGLGAVLIGFGAFIGLETPCVGYLVCGEPGWLGFLMFGIPGLVGLGIGFGFLALAWRHPGAAARVSRASADAGSYREREKHRHGEEMETPPHR